MSVFSSLIDQAEVIKALKDAVLASRNDADKTQGMTHAWLFTGPPGSVDLMLQSHLRLL
jgi:hypothetical protein